MSWKRNLKLTNISAVINPSIHIVNEVFRLSLCLLYGCWNSIICAWNIQFSEVAQWFLQYTYTMRYGKNTKGADTFARRCRWWMRVYVSTQNSPFQQACYLLKQQYDFFHFVFRRTARQLTWNNVFAGVGYTVSIPLTFVTVILPPACIFVGKTEKDNMC